DDTRAEALRALASVAHAARDLRTAAEALETLMKEAQARDIDVRHLAEIYAERGDWDSAIALLNEIPGSTDLLLHYLEQAGRHEQLAQLLESQAPTRNPDESRAFYLRAATLQAGPLADP